MKENVGVFEGAVLDSSCCDNSLVAVAMADGAIAFGLRVSVSYAVYVPRRD